jgi:hypothetical protein
LIDPAKESVVPRDPDPPEAAIVERLRRPDDEIDTEDVIALVGFVGPGKDGDLRLYPDANLQRWMDFRPSDIVDSQPLHPDPEDDRRGRSALEGRHVVWVRQETMIDQPVFDPEALSQADFPFVGSEMSTWPLIPHDRYIAAQLLDLVPSGDERHGHNGGLE